MANAAALIDEGLWRKDKEFQTLPRLAQCTFCQVLSQRDLDTAGVLTLHLDLLAKACNELTVEQLREDFAVLEQRGFLFVDYDTDEVLVRSYVRRVSGVSQSNNAWKSVPKNARMLGSEKLRHVLAEELRRLRWQDALRLADEIDPVATPSEPPPDPVSTQSEGGTPLQAPSDPPSLVSVSVLGSPTVGSSLGGNPPPRYCPKHPNGTDDGCWACRNRREALKAWETRQTELQQHAVAQAASAAAACPVCQGTNWIPDTEPAVRCTHQAAAHG